MVMKKQFILLAVIMILVPLAKAQDASMIFNSKECTWFGLDFSQSRMIGSEGFQDPYQIKNHFFDSWNQLVVAEADKYNIGRAFLKDNVNYYLDAVEKRNELPNMDDLVINSEYTIPEEQVSVMIREYDMGDVTGLGIVFIVEAFDKLSETGRFWVTMFDAGTKEVLLTQKLTGKAGGFGIRNYWAKSYYNVLKDIEKDQYKKWRAKYGGK